MPWRQYWHFTSLFIVAVLMARGFSPFQAVFWATVETHHDLKSGRYIAGLLDNEDKPFNFGFKSGPSDYTPQNLRNEGVR